MQELLAHMADKNLYPHDINLDGKIQRFEIDKNDSKKSGWLVGHQSHVRKSGELFIVAVYGNYKTGETFKYISDGVKMSAEDRKALKLQIDNASKLAEAVRIGYQEKVSHDVTAMWDSLPDTGESEYLVKKKITIEGIKFSPKGECFYVPMRDTTGKLWSVQRINSDGSKFFHPGGKVKECYHFIGSPSKGNILYITEGIATAATINIATNQFTVCAFNSGNLHSVARQLGKHFKNHKIIICGDDDRHTTKPDGTPFNPGREYAEESAKACLGVAVFPKFNDPTSKFSDWNDLHVNFGIDCVREQLKDICVKKHFVLALGFKEKEYFFTSSANRQIVAISAFKEVDFLNLMTMDYWEAMFPGAGASKVDWNIARSSLMQQARDRGIFQSRHVRGAGVWNDENRIVVNMGDHLIVDDRRVELGELKSKFFYTLGVTLNGLHQKPLSSDECDTFIRACSTFKWLKDDHSFLMAGALVISRICGALPIRPHTWITGASQNGKSTLLEGLIKPIMGDPRIHVIGNTSEAGVRQSLKSDAIPVLFDEFETNGPGSVERISGCVELMRSAWSDTAAMIVKGGATGNAVSYQVRFSAIVSSIRTNLNNDADRSRFAVLELAPHGSDQEHWGRLSGLLSQIDFEYGDRLFARTVKMIPVLLQNFKKIKIAMAKRANQRFGDQYGMLLAGYSILLQDEPLSDSQAELVAGAVMLEEERDNVKIADHDDCLTQLLTKKVSLEINTVRHEYSMTRAIKDAINDDRVNEALQILGIRVRLDKVAICVKHTELESLAYKNTRWSNNWANSLSRLVGAEKNKNVWMSGRGQKCVIVPMTFFTSDK